MGRGRAKAKQTKVARLAEELGASTSSPQPPNGERFEDDEQDDDVYARYADLYEDDDEDEDGQSPQQRRGA
jgi:phage terminase small subunit